MSPTEPYGIITLADAAYYPGLMMLHESIQASWPIPVACFDAGLTAEQLQAARRHPNLTILPLPDSGLVPLVRDSFQNAAPLGKKIKRVWPLWICPALIAASPFRKVFWIDCDAVVLRNLRELFSRLEEGPVFTPENNSPDQTPNKPELYQLLPITRNFDPFEPKVNAGVSGWDLIRDADVLKAYAHVVECSCKNPQIAQAVSWHDQGALIWAIQQSGLENRVLDSSRWNMCARNTNIMKSPVPWGATFIPTLRARLPDIDILHWNGLPPPWSLPQN